jgi:UDP-glucose 4-epimerase
MSASESAGIIRGRHEDGHGSRSVAISGARTFLGKNLLKLIEEDERIRRVVVVDADPPTYAGNKTRSYLVDRTQPNAAARIAEILAAEQVDTFVHLGFLEGPVRSAAWAHEFESVGTLNILNACRERRIQKLLLGSTPPSMARTSTIPISCPRALPFGVYSARRSSPTRSTRSVR